jgi:hypothetical protein
MANEDYFLDYLPRVRKAWGPDTSADPAGWTPDNPSWGQDEITALLLQERLGGSIIKGSYITSAGKTGVHVYNDFDGSHFDATSQQYPRGTVIVKSKATVSKATLLENRATVMRFRKIKARV